MQLVLGLHHGFLLSTDLLDTVLLLLALLARTLVVFLVGGHLRMSGSQHSRQHSVRNGKAYTGKAVLGLKLLGRSCVVINQSKARALATTELVVEAVDLWLSFNDKQSLVLLC